MPKRVAQVKETVEVYRPGRPSAFLDTRVVYCGDTRQTDRLFNASRT